MNSLEFWAKSIEIKYPYFSKIGLNPIEIEYLFYHSPRLDYLLEKIKNLINNIEDEKKRAVNILDIGPHFLTQIIRENSNAVVDQLGWRFDKVSQLKKNETHYDFDLNSTIDFNNCPKLPQYDILIACEIIEHLYTSPNYVLNFFKRIVRDDGFLVLGTPNAVSLKHRIVMLYGKNPYELIRETLDNPGHFREYTKNELINYASKNGFELFDFNCQSYYNYIHHGIMGKMYKQLSKILPYSFRELLRSYLAFVRLQLLVRGVARTLMISERSRDSVKFLLV